MESLNRKDETLTVWSSIVGEKDRLRNENMRIITDLNRFSKRMTQLVKKREYLNYKYNEYGNFDEIDDIFGSLSAEYKNARKEAETLKSEYETKGADARTIPIVIENMRKDVAGLRRTVILAGSEIDQVFEAFPDLEERAKESEEIASRYRRVHKDFRESTGLLSDLREKFKRADSEKKVVEKGLSEKKVVLTPLLKTENSLKDTLAGMTDRFNRQEELKEEKRVLDEVIGHLEKSIGEWREKIENHEKKTEQMNKEIKNLKDESEELSSKADEYEAMVAPFEELKEREEHAEKEISLLDEQQRTLTDEILKLKKGNEILGAKARQFAEVKKMMEAMK